MDSNKSINATFTEIPEYALSISIVGNGVITYNGSSPYPEGAKVTLTAYPDTGWEFDGWSGDLVSTDNPVTITMDSNKSINATFTEILYEIEIDIKPGSDPNSINLKSKGVIPVAILTTENFDASTVDPETVMFEGANPVRWAMEDVDGDGDLDMILHFRTQEVGLMESDTEATITGKTMDGISIHGTDSVSIVPSEGKSNPSEKPNLKANPDAPGQNKDSGDSADGKAKGKDDAPGQNKDSGNNADGKAKGKDDAPGQTKKSD